MKPETVKQLVSINRTFYAQLSQPFSASRPSHQARFGWILKQIPDAVSILDIGCGNASLAERLDRAGRDVDYVGIDSSRELIAIAGARAADFAHVRAQFVICEITQPAWPVFPAQSAATLRQRFGITLMLAVLQHVPGIQTRRQVLCDVAALMKPHGRLILSNWQFLNDERMRKKIVPWRGRGIEEADLEPGDALLDWKRQGIGYRYCHQLSEREIEQLGSSCGLQVIDQFLGDGDLNLYSVLQRQ